MDKLREEIEKELDKLDWLGDPKSRASDKSTESYYDRYDLQRSMREVSSNIRVLLRKGGRAV